MDTCKSDLINHFEFQENLSSYIINKLTLSLSLVRSFCESGQLYRGHANTTTLSSSPVVSALGSESDDPGSSPGRGKALCP